MERGKGVRGGERGKGWKGGKGAKGGKKGGKKGGGGERKGEGRNLRVGACSGGIREKGGLLLIGACAMTTKFLDNKSLTFKVLLS